jgi:hypothetical protein
MQGSVLNVVSQAVRLKSGPPTWEIPLQEEMKCVQKTQKHHQEIFKVMETYCVILEFQAGRSPGSLERWENLLHGA